MQPEFRETGADTAFQVQQDIGMIDPRLGHVQRAPEDRGREGLFDLRQFPVRIGWNDFRIRRQKSAAHVFFQKFIDAPHGAADVAGDHQFIPVAFDEPLFGFPLFRGEPFGVFGRFADIDGQRVFPVIDAFAGYFFVIDGELAAGMLFSIGSVGCEFDRSRGNCQREQSAAEQQRDFFPGCLIFR